ncbi:DUF7691 family protein [Acidipropionibacterium jensenii]|uniref:DUF7691 family protein n=1 Tax=Acidipropionibacterium jensenii TaxID=1749 RepID=UPI00214BF2EE|nr:hypothetical protein [Acidipropionibacterium jensenii]
MGELRLHAISIDEVRDVFGADEAQADKLRGWAQEYFSVPDAPRHKGLWSKLRPVTRTDKTAPILPVNWPTPNDVDDLLAGRYVSPDRLTRCWRVLDLWLHKLSWGTHSMLLDAAQADSFEFDLARAGLPSELSLRRLFGGDPQIPLRATPGMRTGYSRAAHVSATAQALASIIDQVVEPTRGLVEQLVDFLTRFQEWSAAAPASGRRPPDLFVVWHAGQSSVDRTTM